MSPSFQCSLCASCLVRCAPRVLPASLASDGATAVHAACRRQRGSPRSRWDRGGVTGCGATAPCANDVRPRPNGTGAQLPAAVAAAHAAASSSNDLRNFPAAHRRSLGRYDPYGCGATAPCAHHGRTCASPRYRSYDVLRHHVATAHTPCDRAVRSYDVTYGTTTTFLSTCTARVGSQRYSPERKCNVASVPGIHDGSRRLCCKVGKS